MAFSIANHYRDFFFSASSASRSLLSSWNATITYPIKTTFAISAAKAPAYVELPVMIINYHCLFSGKKLIAARNGLYL